LGTREVIRENFGSVEKQSRKAKQKSKAEKQSRKAKQKSKAEKQSRKAKQTRAADALSC
jgi:hypothetical protein